MTPPGETFSSLQMRQTPAPGVDRARATMHERTTNFFLLLLSVLAGCTLSQDAQTPFGGSMPESDTEASSSQGEETTAQAPDAVHDVCDRLDACGFLPPGFREVDCVDSTRMCLSDGLHSEVADWELFASGCLQFENCFNFLGCYDGLDTCGVPYDEPGTTSGTTGEAISGADTSGGAADGDTAFEDTGSSTQREGTSTGGDEGEAQTTSASETSGGVPECSGTCDACLDCSFAGPCEVDALECASNLDCLDLADCYGDCEDDACLDTCDFIFDGGVADYQALASCALDACVASC